MLQSKECVAYAMELTNKLISRLFIFLSIFSDERLKSNTLHYSLDLAVFTGRVHATI